jgi:SAM-dependent methyltransferase
MLKELTVNLTEAEAEKRDAFVERILESVGGTFEIFTIYIGNVLGLYQALAAISPTTSRKLAQVTGTQERYVREWLEQQTVVGILDVEDETETAENRRFSISPAHAEVLLEKDSPNYVAPLTQMLAGVVRPLPALLDAFRYGGGVEYCEYGADFREGQAAINRVTYLKDLPEDWIPAMPDLHQRLLDSDNPARIADIGVGGGWSTIGLGKTFPHVIIDGYDLDGPSIELARQNAASVGLNGRVNFHVRDAADPLLAGTYDLVTAFETVHDMSDPVSALRTMRRLVGEDGTVIVVDERVGEEFTAEGNDVEWMMYGWSVLHCLPVGMAEHPSTATGTVMRLDTLRQYAREAGFSDVEVLPIENYFFNVYRLIQ